MASANVDDTQDCPVCYETFTEDGDHTPRILPCFHTVCEKCVKELLANNWSMQLECPECRTEHQANEGHLSFPQNKYVISNLKRMKQLEKETPPSCDLHDRPVVFYCKNRQCKKLICSKCLVEKHKKHNFVDFKDLFEEKRKTSHDRAISLKTEFEGNHEDLMIKKEILAKETEACVEKITRAKSRHMSIFNGMIDNAKLRKTQADDIITEVATSLLENINKLDEEIGAILSKSFLGLAKFDDSLNKMKNTSDEKLSKMNEPKCPQYDEEKCIAEEECGKLEFCEVDSSQLKSREHNLSERTFTHKFQGISKLGMSEEYLYGPEFVVSDIQWSLGLRRLRQEPTKFGMFCYYEERNKSLSCEAKVKLTLMNYEQDNEPLSKDLLTHVFFENRSGWGFPMFEEWKDVTDPENGFYDPEDDSMTVQVHLVVEKPQLM